MLQALREWGDRWAVDTPPVRVRHGDHDLHTTGRCDTCGETVRERDLTWVSEVDDWDLSGPVSMTPTSATTRPSRTQQHCWVRWDDGDISENCLSFAGGCIDAADP